MKLFVNRTTKTRNSVVGELLIGGQHFSYTLEPAEASETIKPRAIPMGTYDVTLRHSSRFGRDMPHVENVPGFEGVLIHWGNYPKDTEACLLVGYERMPDFVGQSRSAFDALFLKLSSAQDPITITYTEAV
jgi:hypothetical protein